ncbi:TIGR04255 family protein [Pseudomonas shirazensis]|uniref:TIGR04255 family protein n=1 Tax=Pseudomonas shirazensis TaxID=2745494 RepID=UPI003D018E57
MVRLGVGQVYGSGAGKVLPSKLAREPMIEAVFEMRFESSAPVAAMLPGILYSKLNGSLSMEQLPPHALPKEMRDADPNFLHVPLTKCSWGNYWILIGDRIFSVASKLPYAGWADFLQKIQMAYGVVLDTGMITTVSRCSIKYVDILDSIPLSPVDCFNMELSVGSIGSAENFHIKIGAVQDGISHTVQLISNAMTQLYGGRELQGPLIDVDSIIDIAEEDSSTFASKLVERASVLHEANKRAIFDAISEAALCYLEPTYE